jgi:hypothetical protein
LGGTKALTSGLSSTNYQQGIIPSCQITVYLTGTQTKATLFRDAGGDTLSNPFTANTAGSVDPGGWIFWAATNQGYDAVMSGGIPPNVYANPVTLTDMVAPSDVAGCPLAGCNFSGPISGPSATFSMIDKGGEVYNVKAYGAKVDGTTDDTAAVNAAKSAASSAGGGVVFIPAGTMITQPIQGVSSVGFRGAGTQQTTWKLIASATPVAPSGSGTCSTTASVVIECFTTAWSISNLTIDGNLSGQSGTTSHGIYVSAVGYGPTSKTQPSISNVTVQFTKTDGIHIDAPSNGQGDHSNITVYNANGIGIYAGSFDTQWSNINVGESGLQGIVIAAASQHFTTAKSWFSGRVTPASGDGILSTTRNNQCDSCEAQDNQFHGIHLNGADGNVFTGVISTGNNRTSVTTGVGVEMQGGNGNIVIGNARGGIDFTPSQLYAVEFAGTSNNHVRMTSSGNVNGLMNGNTANEDVLVIDSSVPLQSNLLGSNMNINGIASLSASTTFDIASSPFVGCTAFGFRSPPSVSGTVVTFASDGVHNGGSISCTDDGGRVTTQSVPNAAGGTAPQTFDLTTQFAVSGATWVQLVPNFGSGTVFVNAPSGLVVQDGGGVTVGTTTLIKSSVSLTNGAASGAGTITNAPTAGNPTKWIPINDNGTTRFIPAW